MSLLTDVKIPSALTDAASQRTNVLVAPPLNFGISPYFLAYPGTLSLRTNTMMDIVEDLVRSSHEHGFLRFLILNGHGGNEPVRFRLFELTNQLPDLRLQWYAWWQSHSVQAVALKYDLKSYHGGWIESFPFTRVSDLPDESKSPPQVTGVMDARRARDTYEDGVFGGPYQAESSIMEEIFNAALQDILQLLKFE